jgi:hypothetical protein
MLFSTVLAAAGLVAQGVSTVASFGQFIKNKNLAAEAERNSEKFFNEAMNKLKVNVYDKLAINKEPYTLASQAALAQGALGIEAAREGEVRGAGASAGRIQMAQNQTQNEIRAAMGTDMYKLQLASAEEDARNRDLTAQLNLAQAEGAQAAAADAQMASQQALGQGMKQLVGLGASAAAMAPDVIKTTAARNVEGLRGSYDDAVKSGSIDNTFLNDKGEPIGFEMTTLKKMGLDDASIQGLPIYETLTDPVTKQQTKQLSPLMFDVWMQSLSKDDLKALGDTGYASLGGLQAPPQERTPRFNNPFDITMGGFNYR